MSVSLSRAFSFEEGQQLFLESSPQQQAAGEGPWGSTAAAPPARVDEHRAGQVAQLEAYLAGVAAVTSVAFPPNFSSLVHGFVLGRQLETAALRGEAKRPARWSVACSSQTMVHMVHMCRPNVAHGPLAPHPT